jgi:hypothetical protein
MTKRLFLFVLLSVFSLSTYAFPVPPATNKDGSPVSGTLEAAFDPSNGVYPFPTNLAFPTEGPIDLTLDVEVEDPDDFGDPRVALSAIDGFSTMEKWTTTFLGNAVGLPPTKSAGRIDPTSVEAGQSVRVFEVTTTDYPYLGVTGIVRELVPLQEFVAASAEGGILAILPTLPLKEMTTYMAVLTNDINDVNGNDATPSQVYGLCKRRTPLIDANGRSTIPLLPDTNANLLEPLRQATMSMELAAASAGVNPADIVLSWTVRTQSITPTLKLLRSLAQPAPTDIAPTGMSTAALGGPGIADIYIGVITLPYYLTAPSLEDPLAFLTEWWRAAPGGYLPPFDQIGLDPESTNLTAVNPIPLPTGVQTVPLIMTVPNANSGLTKPDEGWPVVIYQHGLTRNRTDMLPLADAIASTGRVLISIDQPLHGVVPGERDSPALEAFYVENTPFAPIANERTFDVDIVNNDTFEAGPDDRIDRAGTHSFNLGNLQLARDNIRQAQADLSVLALSIQNMSIDGDATPDLNPFDVAAVTHSGGSVAMMPATAVEPIISSLYVSAAVSGIIRNLDNGDFGPSVLHPLLERAGLIRGTPEYEQFLILTQTLLDPAEPANWAAEAAARIPVVHNQVQEDPTVPNFVPGEPLVGSEAANRIMQLAPYNTTQVNPEGLRVVARFLQPADHESLFRPIYPEVTAEMQSQMASVVASGGTLVQVGNSGLLVPPPAAPARKVNEKDVVKDPWSKDEIRKKPRKPGND